MRRLHDAGDLRQFTIMKELLAQLVVERPSYQTARFFRTQLLRGRKRDARCPYEPVCRSTVIKRTVYVFLLHQCPECIGDRIPFCINDSFIPLLSHHGKDDLFLLGCCCGRMICAAPICLKYTS